MKHCFRLAALGLSLAVLTAAGCDKYSDKQGKIEGPRDSALEPKKDPGDAKRATGKKGPPGVSKQ